MIQFQIVLMFGFVNDLLDLRTINDGVFQQKNTVFDPNKVLKFVVQMFHLQAKKQKISLSFEPRRKLREPDDDTPA